MQAQKAEYRRLRLLTGLLILALGLSGVYLMQVLSLRKEVQFLEARTRGVDETLLAELKLQLKELDKDIQRLQDRRVNLRDHVDFMGYMQGLCDSLGLRLIELPTEAVEHMEDYRVAHIRFSAQGNFHALTRMVYALEHRDRVGSVEYLELRRQTLRVQNERREMLIATLRVNRLLNDAPALPAPVLPAADTLSPETISAIHTAYFLPTYPRFILKTV